MKVQEIRCVLIEAGISRGPCGQVRLRTCRTAQASSSTAGWSSTVSFHGKCEIVMCILIDLASFYEGHSMDLVTFATRVCKLLGVETMIGEISHPLCRAYSYQAQSPMPPED